MRGEWITLAIAAALVVGALMFMQHQTEACNKRGGIYLVRDAVCVNLQRR